MPPTPIILFAATIPWMSAAILGQVPTENLILYSASGLITALCGLLIRALQTQQRAAGRILDDQRRSSDAIVAQWQAIAVHANTTATTLAADVERKVQVVEAKHERRIQDLQLVIDNLEAELDVAKRRSWQYRSDTMPMGPPAPPSTGQASSFPHMPQYPHPTD